MGPWACTSRQIASEYTSMGAESSLCCNKPQESADALNTEITELERVLARKRADRRRFGAPDESPMQQIPADEVPGGEEGMVHFANGSRMTRGSYGQRRNVQ